MAHIVQQQGHNTFCINMSLDIPFKLLLFFSSFSFTGVPAGATTAGLGSQHAQLLPYNNQRTSHFFNVKTFGAQADGSLMTPNFQAFLSAWNKACQATGEVDIMIPKGTYLVGHNSCSTDFNCKLLPTVCFIHLARQLCLQIVRVINNLIPQSFELAYKTDEEKVLFQQNVKFLAMNRTIVRGITSVNSKFFHMALVECKNFKGSKIKISAPADSPNTDGIHIQRSSGVYFSRSLIGTGDDCISIGQGNSQVTITSISCGPGHGISVGSLGRYKDEGDVSGLVVRDCTMIGTSNGIRIKTWANSPGRSAATNMTFENINMENVTNPIIIDQAYCPFASCTPMGPSQVKLSDIYFKKIKGTSLSAVAVALECSKGIPCQDIYLEDVHLELATGEKQVTSTCKNVRAKYIGTQIPPPCA
ncbi:hypothetical protein GOBAR_AA40263 [Gossypium barbadense]|uniref:Pectate lyase superfamily protein domain-containing protein n=1 Tax=Gossypium barbadense TaxID=3634 RepID=A0A2P5VNN6_GOSBA|nr:hypothetical protein GOBAR_AA40263 [Gossypium barbadense]